MTQNQELPASFNVNGTEFTPPQAPEVTALPDASGGPRFLRMPGFLSRKDEFLPPVTKRQMYAARFVLQNGETLEDAERLAEAKVWLDQVPMSKQTVTQRAASNIVDAAERHYSNRDKHWTGRAVAMVISDKLRKYTF